MADGDVYVASVALDVNPMKPFEWTESYNCVSLIITFSLCTEQGVVLANSVKGQRLVVESGY